MDASKCCLFGRKCLENSTFFYFAKNRYSPEVSYTAQTVRFDEYFQRIPGPTGVKCHIFGRNCQKVPKNSHFGPFSTIFVRFWPFNFDLFWPTVHSIRLDTFFNVISRLEFIFECDFCSRDCFLRYPRATIKFERFINARAWNLINWSKLLFFREQITLNDQKWTKMTKNHRKSQKMNLNHLKWPNRNRRCTLEKKFKLFCKCCVRNGQIHGPTIRWTTCRKSKKHHKKVGVCTWVKTLRI